MDSRDKSGAFKHFFFVSTWVYSSKASSFFVQTFAWKMFVFLVKNGFDSPLGINFKTAKTHGELRIVEFVHWKVFFICSVLEWMMETNAAHLNGYKEKLLEFLVFVTNKEDGSLPRKQNTSQCKSMYRGPIPWQKKFHCSNAINAEILAESLTLSWFLHSLTNLFTYISWGY